MPDLQPTTIQIIACPKCGSDQYITVIEGKDRLHGIPGQYNVAECCRCALWFQNPRPTAEHLAMLYPVDYSAYTKPVVDPKYPAIRPDTLNYLQRALGYDHLRADDTAGFDWGMLTPLDILRKWRVGVNLFPRYVKGGKLLEVGCGNGARLLTLRSIGWEQLYGIELGQEAVDIARSNGFAVECGLVENTLDSFPDAHFDVIISSMVLEHLLDPFATVHLLASKLKPGGQFLFSTVNRNSLDAMLYGTYWRNLDLPRHMVFFQKQDLSDMLQADFEHVEMYCHAVPIDFVGSSRYRRGEQQNLLDRLVIGIGEARFRYISFILAWLGLTSRISVRCTRRSRSAL